MASVRTEEFSMAIEGTVQEAFRGAPRWAIVAFAARCGRRIEALFKRCWPRAPAKHVEAVSHAIVLAEGIAAGADMGVRIADVPAVCKQNASDAEDAVNAALDALLAIQQNSDQMAFTNLSKAVAVAKVAKGVADILRAAVEDDRESAAHLAGIVAELASKTPVGFGVSQAGGDSVIRAAATEGIQRDLSRIREAVTSNQGAWDNDTPVPPSVFGAF